MKMLSKFGFVKRSFEIIFCNAMMPDKVKHFAVLALKSTFPFLIRDSKSGERGEHARAIFLPLLC